MAATAAQVTEMRNRERTQTQHYNAKVKATTAESFTIGGVRGVIFCEQDNELKDLHRNSIRTAIEDIVRAERALPSLNFYLTSNDVPNVAMKTYKDNEPDPVIFLGPKMWSKNPQLKGQSVAIPGGLGTSGPRGIANQCYDGTTAFFGNPKQKAQGTAIVIHELGHILHEIRNPGIFWEIQAQTEKGLAITSAPRWAAQAVKVSHYGTNNCLEFVAETFTGIPCGKTYDEGVMTAYGSAGGP